MATKKFALAEGEPKRLEVSYRGRKFRDVVVSFDGVQLNTQPFTADEMHHGRSVDLPDGSRLFVSREKNALEVTRNGMPVPGSSTHPQTRANGAAGVLWLVAGLTAILEIVFFVDSGEFPVFGSLIVALFVVLGIFVRRGSLAALWAGIVIYSIDTLLTLLAGLMGAVIVKVFLIVALVRALPALRELKASEATSPESSSSAI